MYDEDENIETVQIIEVKIRRTVSADSSGFLSAKYQLKENIRTTKLMFTTVIVNTVIALYTLLVFLYRAVDIAAEGPTRIPCANRINYICDAVYLAFTTVSLFDPPSAAAFSMFRAGNKATVQDRARPRTTHTLS
ncbi:unnamed protein product [Gongylonema pulchrum]|uniref:G_PROTEIN_RECEP_F1_2 domain-containing protein n=1 Tax=Gongylonema pulchrum TaxID=637853 RepID=A0A183CWE9_9BILA|nr:unnamed protein product [Gongylonema pulchrum]